MWSLELQWKQDSSAIEAKVNMKTAESYFKANAGTEYRGNSADSKLTLWFNNEPSQVEKDICTNYWSVLGKDVDSSISGTGLVMSLAAAASYTIAVGDQLTIAGEIKTINGVTDQQNFTIDSAFTADPVGATCVICSPDIHSYVDQTSIQSALDLANAGLQIKIEAGDAYSTYTIAEKKLAAGMMPTEAELGL